MIKFVREYTIGKQQHYDVVHDSNRCFFYTEESLPNTAAAFISKAVSEGKCTNEYDATYKRDEIIYG